MCIYTNLKGDTKWNKIFPNSFFFNSEVSLPSYGRSSEGSRWQRVEAGQPGSQRFSWQAPNLTSSPGSTCSVLLSVLPSSLLKGWEGHGEHEGPKGPPSGYCPQLQGAQNQWGRQWLSVSGEAPELASVKDFFFTGGSQEACMPAPRICHPPEESTWH